MCVKIEQAVDRAILDQLDSGWALQFCAITLIKAAMLAAARLACIREAVLRHGEHFWETQVLFRQFIWLFLIMKSFICYWIVIIKYDIITEDRTFLTKINKNELFKYNNVTLLLLIFGKLIKLNQNHIPIGD